MIAAPFKCLFRLFVLAALYPPVIMAHALFDNPAGVLRVDWRSTQISDTYATGVFNTMGLRVDNDPSRARVVEDDTGRTLEGIALTFNINDHFAFDIDQTALATIELDTTNVREFFVAYDRNGGPDSLIRVAVPKNASGWRTFKVELPRARFANRGYGGTDFAIASGVDMSNRVLKIRSIKFSLAGKAVAQPAAGIVEIVTADKGTDNVIATQVGLYDATGRIPLPGMMAIELQVFDQTTRLVEVRQELDDLNWPHENRYTMYIDGFYRARIPAGEYTLIVARGPEYEIVEKSLVVTSNATTRVEVDLNHEIDMPAKGWFSGDVHNHFTRENSGDNNGQMAHARAQNLHMHWLNEIGNSATTHFPQFAFGDAGEYGEQSYYIASGQEDPRTDFLGHILSLGQDQRVRNEDTYLRYDIAAKELRKAGGVVGIAHMDFAQFWQDIALALLAAEDQVDFVEVMQFNTVNTRDWYNFLNMGFRLPAAAGSDWPYMALPGSVRTYVEVDGEFSPDTWKRGLQAGRSFVSNGPMLEFTVDGKGIGSIIQAETGDTVNIQANATIVPSRDLLKRIDLIANGQVVKSVTVESPVQKISLQHDLKIETGTWLAIHAVGTKSRDIVFQAPYTMRTQAHTSPIYLEVDDCACDPALAAVKIDNVLDRLNGLKTADYARNDNEVWESTERTAELVTVLRPEVNAWIDEAIGWYAKKQKQYLQDGDLQ